MDVRVLVNDQPYQVDFVNTQEMRDRKGPIATRHRHPVYHFIYITKGRGQFVINDQASDAQEGMLYIISPNEWHRFSGSLTEPMTDLESTFLLVNREHQALTMNFFEMMELTYPIELPLSFRKGPILVPDRFKPLLIQSFQRVMELDPLFAYSSSSRANHLNQLKILDLIYRVMDVVIQTCLTDSNIEIPHTTADLNMAGLKQYIHQNLDRPLSLVELAASIYVTPNYLCRFFKKHTGTSPLQYIQQLKIEEAIKRLLYTDYSVQMISEQLGYSSASYFARVFSTHTGVSPTAYRKAKTKGNRLQHNIL